MARRRNKRAPTVVANLVVNPGGYGFAHPHKQEETGQLGDENVFIPPGGFAGAIDGDEVLVSYWASEKGWEGQVEEVLKRGRTRLVGLLQEKGKHRNYRLAVDDPRIIWPVRVSGGPGSARPGQIVVADIGEYPDEEISELTVVIDRALGDPGTMDVEIQRILIENEIADTFPGDITRLAKKTPSEVTLSDLEGRADLRGLEFMTIDPIDARDFDDAVVVELLGDHEVNDPMRLHVAVADVSHYVREGSRIDEEASARCFSTYLPHRAIPMLPEQLSTHICSLVPKEDRLAMVVSMTVDAAGVVSDEEVRAAVIHSRARLSYEQAAQALGGEGRLGEDVAARVSRLRLAADRLRAFRLRRGAVELDLSETKILLDEDDRTRIRNVVRSRSSEGMRRAYNLIEEMMIAANEAVGRIAEAHKLPAVFRVHAKPDEEKLNIVAAAAFALGVTVDPEKLQTPRGMQKFLSRVKSRERAQALNMLLLRSMAQAEYSTENVGHFALASTAYVHFTSPIRRYPDVISHRVMKAHLKRLAAKGIDAKPGPRPIPRMPKPAQSDAHADTSSTRERAAAAAERECVKLFAAAHMLDRVGDRLEGTVSGMSASGVFVQLDEPYVDGMIKLANIERELGERFSRDETGVRMVGGGGERVITVGDRVMVEVEAASLQRRQIDLAFISLLRD